MPVTAAASAPAARPVVRGKFFRLDGRRWPIKGVAYGTFAPDADGCQFPPAADVARDFGAMARAGINTVRLYTPPPPWLPDLAADAGLRLIVGVAWAQHVAFLDDPDRCREIRREVTDQVARLASHPAVLLFALGNEIPAAVARWHGRTRIERFLRELYHAAKETAPDSLQTYVNYPPTEFLDLSFLDVAAFNVYLHGEAELRAYLARLHNLVGNRPLLLAEAGADSIREGTTGQAALTAMQVRAALAEGACGAVVYTWTDEWWRGGAEVDDWAFGLVDRHRRPKPALDAVSEVFAEPSGPAVDRSWPKVSVVVCAYNAADTLDACLTSLDRLAYPDVEILVVDDGSTDATARIARRHPAVRLIQVENGGLSAARNIGLARATGEIVAYTDADVTVEPEWLTYLVAPFFSEGIAGSGGPNVVPAGDPWLAQCVARAPGGPSHVLLEDRVAEHVPGCNMAFRRDVLLALDGFNEIFTRAGDDVDLCWRLQARGWRIGFAPCALVWHHHRSSIRAYWRQQLGYGEGESWLRPLHPDKFVGRRALWQGHIYSPLPFVRSLRGSKVNAGVWGTAAFPSVYRFDAHPFAHLPHSIRWQLAAGALLLAGAAMLWTPFVTTGALLLSAGGAAFGTTCVRCVKYALDTDVTGLPEIGWWGRRMSRAIYRATVAWLHFIQPLARTHGRIRGLLSPGGAPGRGRHEALERDDLGTPRLWSAGRLLAGRMVEERFWGDRFVRGDLLLRKTTDWLRLSRAVDLIEIDDGWRPQRDCSLAAGRWVWLDLRALVEEHERGRCLVRIALSTRLTSPGRLLAALAAASTAALAGVGLAVDQPLLLVAAAGPVAGGAVAVLAPVLRTLGVVREAVAKVTAELGLTALPAPETETA